MVLSLLVKPSRAAASKKGEKSTEAEWRITLYTVDTTKCTSHQVAAEYTPLFFMD